MRISDWSSDVCSSDLGRGISVPGVLPHRRPQKRAPVTVKYLCSTAAGAPQRTDTATSTEAKTNKAAYCMSLPRSSVAGNNPIKYGASETFHIGRKQI